MTQPRLIARVRITNGGGTFDSQPLVPSEETIRIAFDVQKSIDQQPNTATIRLWNLSPERVDQIQGVVVSRVEWTIAERAALRTAGLSSAPIETVYDNAGIAAVVFSWGYEGAAPPLPFPPLSEGFVGGSVSMEVDDNGEDSILTLKCEDAGQIMTAARLNQSYSSGTDTVTIVVDLINAMGLTVNDTNLRNLMQSSLLKRAIPIGKLQQIGGYNASRVPAAQQLRRIMKSLNLRWSAQDGRFLLLDRESVIPGYPPIVLSAATDSLFNNPRRRQAQQMAVQTWATPEIRPGREVLIQANELSTQYRVDRVTHTGDTEEGGQSVPVLDKIQII